MARPAAQPLTWILIAAIAVVGGALWYSLSGEPARPAAPLVAGETPAAPIESKPGAALSELPPEPISAGVVASTVLWPLRVELELVRPADVAVPANVRPIGSDRSARLAGRIADADERGVRGRVRFVHGPNQGRELSCDREGAFGATDLYPGIDILELSGPGVIGARREVLLRQGSETQLNIGFGRPASCYGTVLDEAGKPIAGASVAIDGVRGFTDEQGVFFLGGMASGRTFIEIEKPGFAALREDLNLTAAFTIPIGRLAYKLRTPCELTLIVKNDLGSAEPAEVILLPATPERTQRVFPWYRINPVKVFPGSPVTVRELPPGPLSVRCFRAGAQAGQEQVVNLRADDSGPQSVTIELEAAPQLRGRVLLANRPVAGARVKLEAIDRVNATLSYAKKSVWFLESDVLPPMAPALQEARSDGAGRFTFSAWAQISPLRFLEARTEDGRYFAHRLVKADDQEVDLLLQPSDQGKGALRIALPGRTQGLPVEVLVNGAPRDPYVLDSARELVIDGLNDGIWRVKASFDGATLFSEAEVDLRGTAEREIALPPAALNGQSAEEWSRAGREFPGG